MLRCCVQQQRVELPLQQVPFVLEAFEFGIIDLKRWVADHPIGRHAQQRRQLTHLLIDDRELAHRVPLRLLQILGSRDVDRAVEGRLTLLITLAEILFAEPFEVELLVPVHPAFGFVSNLTVRLEHRLGRDLGRRRGLIARCHDDEVRTLGRRDRDTVAHPNQPRRPRGPPHGPEPLVVDGAVQHPLAENHRRLLTHERLERRRALLHLVVVQHRGNRQVRFEHRPARELGGHHEVPRDP